MLGQSDGRIEPYQLNDITRTLMAHRDFTHALATRIRYHGPEANPVSALLQDVSRSLTDITISIRQMFIPMDLQAAFAQTDAEDTEDDQDEDDQEFEAEFVAE